MSIHTFKAPTMQEALVKVKRAMGVEAVILHTRSMRRGGILGFWAREIVEITASDEAAVLPRPRPVSRQAAAYNQADSVASARTLLEKARSSAMPRGRRDSNAPAPHTGGDAGSITMLRDDLRSIKTLVREVARHAAKDADRGLPKPLASAYRRLIANDVSESAAWDVVCAVREALPDPETACMKKVETYLSTELSARLRTSGPLKLTPGSVRAVMCIGPTGVGKTTTIAKLAADFAVRGKAKVALVTLDTYRIAAVEQLRTYARIIGVPLTVAQTPGELAAALDEYKTFDLVLVDTAGRSQRDAAKMTELESMLDAACRTERYLVIDSTVHCRKAFEVADRFGPAKPAALILTKVDEAASLGMLLDLAGYSNLPVSYVTTGQEVPDDIEVARPESLAELVIEREAGDE